MILSTSNLLHSSVLQWLAIACVVALAFPSAAQDYQLGPDDRLTIRAVVWNEAEQQFDNWDVVSGEYVVQANGTIMLPLTGPISASGHTTAELAPKVSEALQSRAVMIEPPAIAMEIIAYRPFYILGDVAQPGPYPATPGLTVLQAVALAGGRIEASAQRNADTLGQLREAGNLRDVLNQIYRARAREARLVAERTEAETVTFPSDLWHPDGPEAIARIIEEERAIFMTRKAGLERELAALEELDALLLAEVAGLESKLAGQAEQIELSRQNFANLEALSERGLTRTQQLTAARRDLIGLEASETDLQSNLFRARQRIAENARDIVELSAQRAIRATVELQEVRADLEALEIRKATLEQIIVLSGLELQTFTLVATEVSYSILRQGQNETSLVDAATTLRPGDVLTVEVEIVNGAAVSQ